MNKWRGETQVRLNGEDVTLRPTLEAIMKIEGKGNSVLRMAMEFQRKSLRFSDAAIIISAASGKPYKEVLNQMGKQGLVDFIGPIGEFLEACLSGLGPTTGVDTPSSD